MAGNVSDETLGDFLQELGEKEEVDTLTKEKLMETDPVLPSLDAATSRVTAFQTFEALVRACRVDGYVPTLIPRGPRQHAQDIGLVTRALRELGYRVYSGGDNTV